MTMKATIALFLMVAIVVIRAYPPVEYGYVKEYKNDYEGNGFVGPLPRYGSGYDKYVYGYYDGHPGNYNYNHIKSGYETSKSYHQTPYASGHY